MNREDIIRMAREAAEGMKGFTPKVKDPSGAVLEFYERFAALVASAEREACAKVAQSYEPCCDTCPSGVTNAIRARARGHA